MFQGLFLIIITADVKTQWSQHASHATTCFIGKWGYGFDYNAGASGPFVRTSSVSKYPFFSETGKWINARLCAVVPMHHISRPLYFWFSKVYFIYLFIYLFIYFVFVNIGPYWSKSSNDISCESSIGFSQNSCMHVLLGKVCTKIIKKCDILRFRFWNCFFIFFLGRFTR